jgi:hypothetical protein
MNYYNLYDAAGQDYEDREQYYPIFTVYVPELWEMVRDSREWSELAEKYRAAAKRLAVKIQAGQFKTPGSVEGAQNAVGFYHRRASELEDSAEKKTQDAAHLSAAIAISRMGKP